jgi:hypothetical protein
MWLRKIVESRDDEGNGTLVKSPSLHGFIRGM